MTDRADKPVRGTVYTVDASFIESLKRQAADAPAAAAEPLIRPKATPINQKIHDAKLRKQEIENTNAEKDQQLKEETLTKLFRFLLAETAIIFMLAFLQGFGTLWRWKFELDSWSFRLVIVATIGQITAMLIIAVRHLFPRKK